MSKLPICVGFGIKSRNQIKHLNKFSDGCVVGSALVSLIEEFDNGKVNENTMLKNISNLTNSKKINVKLQNMNWITNYVKPKLQAFVGKKEVPDNLWETCPKCSQMLLKKELINQSICL